MSNAGNGLQSMGARFYRTGIGRFLTRDPLGITALDANLYRYALNNTTNSVDPTGLGAVKDFLVAVGSDITTHSTVVDGVVFLAEDPSRIKNFANGVTTLKEASNGCGLVLGLSSDPAAAGELGCPQHGGGNPNPPGGNNGDDGGSGSSSSHDPNDKIGPAGFGPQGFVAPSANLPYHIDFENAATATAPAQQVTITDQLSANLDWSSFNLTGIGWGDNVLSLPPNAQHYQTTVPVLV